MTAHHHDSTPLTKVVHLLLLLGWLLSSHGVAPAICMAAALLDGDHAVKVGLANDGALKVVLSHAGKSLAELSAHEHDALCRVLVAFAEAPASDAADHVLAFKTVSDASRTQRPLASAQSIVKAAASSLTLAFNSMKPYLTEHAGRPLQRRPWSQGLALKSGRTVMRC